MPVKLWPRCVASSPKAKVSMKTRSFPCSWAFPMKRANPSKAHWAISPRPVAWSDASPSMGAAAALKAVKETAEAAKEAVKEAKADAEAAIDVIVADSELGEPPAKKPKN